MAKTSSTQVRDVKAWENKAPLFFLPKPFAPSKNQGKKWKNVGLWHTEVCIQADLRFLEVCDKYDEKYEEAENGISSSGNETD